MGVNRHIYNLCAGMMEKGEDIEQTISRELHEETGLFVDKIIDICNEYDIPLEITMFQSSPDEMIRIIEICNKHQVPVASSMFNKTATEVETIIEICKRNKIDTITGSMFKRNQSEVEAIINKCNELKIKKEGSVFYRTADEIQEIFMHDISFCLT